MQNIKQIIRQETEKLNPMEKYVLCKIISRELEQEMKKTLPEANRIYTEDNPGTVLNCKIQKQSPRAVWEYSQIVKDLEKSVKLKKQEEQMDGTALKTVPEADPAKTALFKVLV